METFNTKTITTQDIRSIPLDTDLYISTGTVSTPWNFISDTICNNNINLSTTQFNKQPPKDTTIKQNQNKKQEQTKSTMKTKDPNEFSWIEEYVPNKVYSFTFSDGTIIKTVVAQEDQEAFDLEYAFYLALAKKNFKSYLTLEGIESTAYKLRQYKYYANLVKKGIKLFTKIQKVQKEKLEEEKRQKEKHKRYIEKKKKRDAKRAEQIKQDLYNIIHSAIKDSK